MRYVVANFGQQIAIRMQIPRPIAAEISAVCARGRNSAAIIPVAAIIVRPTNG
jgi:hypothetical protein